MSKENKMIILPGTIASKINVSIKDVYFVLEKLVQIGLLEQILLYVCPNCGEIAEEEYESINCLPDTFCCNTCHKETENVLENVIIAYKRKSP